MTEDQARSPDAIESKAQQRSRRRRNRRRWLRLRGGIWALFLVLLLGLGLEPAVRGLFFHGWRSILPPAEYLVPVQNVSKTDLQSSWGAPRSGGRKHEGIDIAGPRGTPVLAAASGVVIRIGTSQLGGRIVWILGRPLTRYYYAHLESWQPKLAVGNWVDEGEIIGFVGDSGNAKGTFPHLHFGMYPLWNAFRAVDPFPYLARRRQK